MRRATTTLTRTAWLAAVLITATGWIGDLSWRMPFVLYALSLVWLLVAWFVLFEPAPIRNRGRGRLPSWRRLLLIGGIVVPGSVAFYTPSVEVAFLLKQHGAVAPSTAGDVIALSLVLAPLGSLLSRRLTKVATGRVLSLSMVLMGAGLAIMGMATAVPGIATGLVVQQIGGPLMMATGMTYVLGLADPDDRGLYAGVWFFCYMGAQFITPLVMSVFMSLTGTSSGSVLAAGVLAASMCFWLFPSAALRQPVVPVEQSALGH
jgi:MFS family permease